MNNKILVTYATCTGYTPGVAEAIAATLAEGGLQVDVLPMQAVGDLGPYRAVVAGSPIQGQHWLPEAVQFIQAHRADLARKPCAMFTVCMTLAMPKGEQYRQAVLDWVQPVRALVRPVSEGLFAGGLEIRKVPRLADRMKFRISVLAKVWSEGDHRDWEAIRAWAQQLSPLLAC